MDDFTLVAAIAESPSGKGIEDLLARFGSQVSRRTLQRRLDGLLGEGKIERIGKARSTRYLALNPEVSPVPKSVLNEHPTWKGSRHRNWRDSTLVREEEDLPAASEPQGPEFSPESQELRHIVRTPQAFRKPAGYRREFLEDYLPNQTAYLPENLRAHLHAVGQSEQMAALPPGTYARQVLDRLIIDLSYNSSRLEGNTYSLLETDHLLAQGTSEDPVRFVEAQMILNHKAAIEFLVEAPSELGFNRYTFLNLHAILTEGLLKNPASEGSLRQIPVGIGGTVYHPVNHPQVIEECFDLILNKAAAIKDPLECCFFLMVHLPYLQPFEDGNKRSSRLAANLPLIKHNMAPLSFIDVPLRHYTDGIIAVYELNRVELLRDVFVWAYERSAGRYAAIRNEVGEPDPLHLRYRDEIKDRIRDVVVNRLDKPAAARFIQRWATTNVTASDRSPLIQIIEERLLALREGSIARSRIRPSEFAAWWPIWSARR